MGVRLTVRHNDALAAGAALDELVVADDVILLGRDRGCQVVLPQMAVSRSHARIVREGTLFFLEDLGSAYGTAVNGVAVARGEKRLLRDGDTIGIGQFEVVFGGGTADVPRLPADERTSFISRAAARGALKGVVDDGPWLRVMNGAEEGRRIEITEAKDLIVGRSAGADLVIEDALISRRHARIGRDWSGVQVEDLASRNGIRVNGHRVERATLRDRDELQIGPVRLLFVDPRETATRTSPEDRTMGGRTPPPVATPARAPEPPAGSEDPGPVALEAPLAEASIEEVPADSSLVRFAPLVAVGVVAIAALIVAILAIAGA